MKVPFSIMLAATLLTPAAVIAPADAEAGGARSSGYPQPARNYPKYPGSPGTENSPSKDYSKYPSSPGTKDSPSKDYSKYPDSPGTKDSPSKDYSKSSGSSGTE